MNKKDAYAALRIPDYRRFLFMRMTTTLATQIMSVAVGYWMYELTGDPLMLGMIGLAEAIPAIGISLYAGHAADKYNRKYILAGCILSLFACALILVGLAVFRDSIPRHWLVGGIFTVIFFTGISRGFFSPTNFSYLPLLVDKDRLANAITWNSSTWEVASITGLGLGGLLYGFAGIGPTFIVMSTLYGLSFLFLWQIPNRPAPVPERVETAVERIREGLRFVFNSQLIIAAIALDLFAVLFGGAVALLPIYARDILKVGPEGMGLLRAAMSIGAIIMTFYLAHRPMGAGAGKRMLACVAGFGLCMIAFGLSTNFYLSFFLLMLAGMCDEVSVFIRGALVQFYTPENMKGRVSSVNSIFITSSNEIGAFESGVAARMMGTVPSVVFGGCMTLLTTLIAWRYAPKLRDFDFKEGR